MKTPLPFAAPASHPGSGEHLSALSPRTVFVDATATVATCANVVLWRWHAVGSDVAMRRVVTEAATLGKTYPNAVGLVHLVASLPGKMPDDQDRERIVRTRRDLRSSVRASALVFEGDSLRGAIIRSVTTAMILASRDNRPLRVFPETVEAARWLSKQWDPVVIDAAALSRAMETVKAVPPGAPLRSRALPFGKRSWPVRLRQPVDPRG